MKIFYLVSLKTRHLSEHDTEDGWERVAIRCDLVSFLLEKYRIIEVEISETLILQITTRFQNVKMLLYSEVTLQIHCFIKDTSTFGGVF